LSSLWGEESAVKKRFVPNSITLGAFAALVVGCGQAPLEEPLGTVQQRAGGARFATYCQESFQNGWQETLSYANERCSMFRSQLNNTDTDVFYFNLNGAKPFIEQGGDHQPDLKAIDDVDLMYMMTHGGATTTDARWTMWNDSTRAMSSNMRLGDSAWWGGGLAIYAQYSCKTMKSLDNLLVNRWGPVLRGGLKLVLGSHDILWDGERTDECGEAFAENIQYQQSFRTAWRDALYDTFLFQDIAVMATGTDSSNCSSRKNNMKWQNFGSHPFIRDGSIGITCWEQWTDY
jgi:hypothetical protein